MGRNQPSGSEREVSRPGSSAALYLRVATALERSAGLAEQHAVRLSREGDEHLAARSR